MPEWMIPLFQDELRREEENMLREEWEELDNAEGEEE